MSPVGDGLGEYSGTNEVYFGDSDRETRGPAPTLRTASLPVFEGVRQGWKDVANFSLPSPTWE